jgi:hypothetical protein
MDNSGTMAEGAVKYRSDTRGRTIREGGASRRALNSAARADALLAKFRDTRRVRRWKCSHDDVDVWQGGEHIQPYDFAQPAFHAIAIDGRV